MKISYLEYNGFEWDLGNLTKIKSRISISEIENFFQQELLIKADLRHSQAEERFLAIGYEKISKRCLLVAFTFRLKGHDKLIRPISARYTHRKEEEAYEREIKELKKSE